MVQRHRNSRQTRAADSAAARASALRNIWAVARTNGRLACAVDERQLGATSAMFGS
jgi:hypothetical protein